MNYPTFEENEKLIADLKSIPPSSKTPEEIYNEIVSKPLLSGDDLLNLPYQSNDYYIDNFLWRYSIGVIIAREKVGKTIFATQMAMSLTSGDAFLGQFHISQPCKVLYIQAEGTLYDMRDNISSALINGRNSWNPNNWRHYFCPSIPLDTDNGRQMVMERIDRAISEEGFKPNVCFIDPLYMSLKGGLNPDEPARNFCGNIRIIQEKYGCAFLILHHEHRRKRDMLGGLHEEGDDSIHGSFVWKAFPTHIIRITNDDRTKIRTVSCNTSRNGKAIDKISLRLLEDPLMFEPIMSENSKINSSDIILNVLTTKERMTYEEICNMSNMKLDTVRHLMMGLSKKNLVKRVASKGRNAYYSITKAGIKQNGLFDGEDS